MFNRLVGALLIAASVTLPAAAWAQGYPNRGLRIVVPFPPGGVTDLVGRALSARLAVELGQPVVVENRPGASGVLGADLAARAAPDGYTLMIGNISTLAINAATFAKLPYDPVRSFAPVSLLALQPLLIAVNPSVPAQSLAELVALAKSRPGRLNYGTAGSSIYLAVESFNRQAGIKMNHVPYKGSAPAIADLLGGQIDVLFDPFSTLYPQAKAGKARGLAVTTERRSSVAPDVPTVAESGLASFDVSSWQALVVPAGTPKDVIERLHAAVLKALASPELKQQFAAQGAEPSPSTPQRLEEYIRAEITRWQQVARDAGVKPE
ncbi:MAG TPA: tripartite tricarboxylate transporter substrate binding protein [Burkholderiaceae bacterium]|jgi:tripartite-type tricarboxylate transporter receptor subunit TctC|nr:tripartite tricarboxylate transporter substrate binding protein [Burkholderiaceae bacterium]